MVHVVAESELTHCWLLRGLQGPLFSFKNFRPFQLDAADAGPRAKRGEAEDFSANLPGDARGDGQVASVSI